MEEKSLLEADGSFPNWSETLSRAVWRDKHLKELEVIYWNEKSIFFYFFLDISWHGIFLFKRLSLLKGTKMLLKNPCPTVLTIKDETLMTTLNSLRNNDLKIKRVSVLNASH